ncbi:MAG: MBL fold metallo-hydrolase [Myxococcales bacterium]|jgi:glyoxylase-like metal-dependent hydrolase (beta-lactamase superfamily II)
MGIPFRHEESVEYGVLQTRSPLVRRIVARNPSAFTYHGTGTYVVGHGKVAVIDAGPDQPGHVEALLSALEGEEITHQLVTHTHIDHSPATRHVRERTGARTYGFGPHGEGRYERGAKVEAGADQEFHPDEVVGHGDVISGDGWSIECVHTPGHCSNHLCFALREERALFTGDHVMAWSTSIISPPDGDMADYMASLRLLLDRDDALYYPTHGVPIDDPIPFVRAFIAHREAREAQVLACLQQGVERIPEMVKRMYADIPAFMHGAAARSVLAHMLHMLERDMITCEGEPGVEARYRLR